jgi:hypothetical protein
MQVEVKGKGIIGDPQYPIISPPIYVRPANEIKA